MGFVRAGSMPSPMASAASWLSQGLLARRASPLCWGTAMGLEKNNTSIQSVRWSVALFSAAVEIEP